MKKYSSFLFAFFFLLSCSGRDMGPQIDKASAEAKAMNAPAADPVERKILKEADLRFETEDLMETLQFIHGLVDANGAYISEESQNGYGNQSGFDLVIRVPQQKLDTLITGILSWKELKKLENKSVRMQDVTEEFIDAEARMEVKKQTEQKYLDLLKQARNLEETLAVEQKLSELRADIESLEGRLKYLNNRVELSTLRLSFYEKQEFSSSFIKEFSHGLAKGWQIFLLLLTGIAHLWVLIILAVGIYFFIRWRIRKKVDK